MSHVAQQARPLRGCREGAVVGLGRGAAILVAAAAREIAGDAVPGQEG